MAENTFLKSLADKMTVWDQDLTKLMGRASEVAAEKKVQFDQVAGEVKVQATQLKGKVDEYRGKSADELKAEAEEVMRQTSGKIAEGLTKLAQFFEEKSQGPSAKA